MPASDSLIFIDANKYLDLYRTDKGRETLAELVTEQSSHIFITQQIVDEVQRNKLKIVAEFLRTKTQDVKLLGTSIPDHFSGSVAGITQEILKQMKDINGSVTSVNREINAHTLEIMAQVASSEDEVSKALSHIYSKAVRATPDEMQRARKRKEVGNPPGKHNNPLGDEITWEQILSHFKGKKRLWIISRDHDYGTPFGKSIFLNSFLKLELSQISDNPSVYIFENLIDGLRDFAKKTGAVSKVKLTVEEAAEIEAEEQSLPPIESCQMTNLQEAIAAMQSPASQSLVEQQKTCDAIRALPVFQMMMTRIQAILISEESMKAQHAPFDIPKDNKDGNDQQ